MSAYAGGQGDDVSIVVGGNKIAGWETVEIVRSCEVFPNHFSLSMTEQFSSDPARILANPGERCQIKIGSDVVVTGFVDRYTARISPNSHEVNIVGRGLGEDLVDCSADIRSASSPVHGGNCQAPNAVTLAQQLVQPWGITARSAVSDLGREIRTFQVALGETPYEIIERVARYTGYLVYEDEYGALVLDRAPSTSSNQMASGFVQGVNVEDASGTIAVDERFTRLDIVYNTVDGFFEGPGGTVLNNERAFREDPGLAALGRFRPRIVVSLQTDQTPDFAQRMADWEMARRRGRSQAITVVCDRWRDKNGRLWQPNWLAPVHMPALKLVNQMWVIGTVAFRKDTAGTHAEVTLMPPAAFGVQPSPLSPWDLEFSGGRYPASQSPKPPSTSTEPTFATQPTPGGF